MRDFETYERHQREGETWYLRGRLRLSYLSGRVRPLEEILARAQLLLEAKRRMLLRGRLDDHDYELRVYRQGGLLRRSRPLDQLEFATRAVGAGIDVSPLDAACVAGGHVVIFQEDPEDWIHPAHYLASSKIRSAAKQQFLRAVARYCRRLHDAGFYQSEFGLGTLRARVLTQRTDFRVHDVDGAAVQEIDDDDRFEMLGRAWQQTPLDIRLAMRFLRAYLKEGEDSRKIALLIWHYYGRKIQKPKPATPAGEGQFAIDAFDVRYRKGGTDPEELTALYRGGLKHPSLRIIRSPDALTFWKRAMKEAAQGESLPIACFVRHKQTGGFVLYRAMKEAEEPLEPT